jgi:hypothetical protein
VARPSKLERDQPNPIPPLRLAFFLIVLLPGFTLLPWVRDNPRLAASFWVAAAALLVFLLVLRRQVARSRRALCYEVVPKPVHYVQLAMHTSIYIYWGWYWREVYHYAPLIVAQIVFVYAFDMLLCWSRRDKWILGFGPFPIVLSTNLFLWFKDDWFYLQFLLVAAGVLCKEFLTWTRDGRRVHIFNPSAIALAIFSVGLLVTHSTQITWGEEVAVTLGRPPNIYLEIFLVGLVVQALFSVTLVTLSAAAALYALNLAYTGTTGVYHFVDSNIPIAVFLGLHLLVTDPATSPRTSFGKVLFGGMYGAGVFSIYAALGRMGAPTFYDKLLCVPPLNLIVQALDRAALRLAARLGRWKLDWSPRQANFAHMALWISLFAVMLTTGFYWLPPPRRPSRVLGARLPRRPPERLPNVGAYHGCSVPPPVRRHLRRAGTGVERRTCGPARPRGGGQGLRRRLRHGDAQCLPEPHRAGAERGPGCVPAALQPRRWRELLHPGVALLRRTGCSQGRRSGRRAVSPVLRPWLVARVRRSGGMLSGRARNRGRQFAGDRKLREGLPRRNCPQLLCGRHDVPWDAGRNARPAAIPPGLRVQQPVRGDQRCLFPIGDGGAVQSRRDVLLPGDSVIGYESRKPGNFPFFDMDSI